MILVMKYAKKVGAFALNGCKVLTEDGVVTVVKVLGCDSESVYAIVSHEGRHQKRHLGDNDEVFADLTETQFFPRA